MIYKIIILICALQSFFSLAYAESGLITSKRYFLNPHKIGEAKFTYLFWDIYHAELYAPISGWNPEKPFALSLKYFREFEGIDIADKSISEIEGQGFSDRKLLDEWKLQLREILPDVSDGTILTGIRNTNGHTLFYHDGSKIGVIKDTKFTKRFFNIWLGKKTSEPSLRRALLGDS
tara:strand:+ start:17458 stop:17985 length:528 start_codon:yes stop_codon:yes gene_type:complete